MTGRSSIRVNCKDRTTALSLASVLMPDNTELPRRLSLVQTVVRDSVLIDLESTDPIVSLTAVASILNDATLFQEVSFFIADGGRKGLKERDRR